LRYAVQLQIDWYLVTNLREIRLYHIFEQSISDLEEMQERIAGREKQSKAKVRKKTSRKEAGAFYTPSFITRYIVAQSLGPMLAAWFEQCHAVHEMEWASDAGAEIERQSSLALGKCGR